jgi:hypothetical protein
MNFTDVLKPSYFIIIIPVHTSEESALVSTSSLCKHRSFNGNSSHRQEELDMIISQNIGDYSK